MAERDGITVQAKGCSGPRVTYAEVVARDGIKPPPDMGAISPPQPPRRIEKARYTSRAVHEAEVAKLWSKTWQMSCRAEEIPEVGDYIVYDIVDVSLIVVQSEPGVYSAYYNSCLHRGMQLRAEDGYASEFRCPFHGFTWDLKGNLVDVPCRWDFGHLEGTDTSLPKVQVDVWGGFIFVNLDPQAGPLLDYLGVLPEHMARWDFEKRYIKGYMRKVLPANWKASLEAFLEAYHVWETHRQAAEYGGDGATQYDVLSPNVSRFQEPLAVQGEMIPGTLTEQEILAGMMGAHAGREVDVPQLAPGQTARMYLAAQARAAASVAHNTDYSWVSDSEAMDSLEHFVFPNFVLFRGLAIPLLYRFRPNGNDVDSCIFDLILIDQVPEGAARPEPAPVTHMGIDDLFANAGILPEWLGVVYDQDTYNLGMLQKGLKAGGRDGIMLAQYQELRVRHVHDRLDDFLNA